MEKLNFSVSINAPKEKIWRVLWDDATYRTWTSAFMEGSYAETENWREGSKVLFLDGKGNGMVSMVVANKPNEYMSFKHIGVVKNGEEDLSSAEVKGWAGAHENYTLKQTNGITELKVEMDITDEYKSYFTETWPKALDKVKELAEEV